jgi:hypothetical protein
MRGSSSQPVFFSPYRLCYSTLLDCTASLPGLWDRLLLFSFCYPWGRILSHLGVATREIGGPRAESGCIALVALVLAAGGGSGATKTHKDTDNFVTVESNHKTKS